MDQTSPNQQQYPTQPVEQQRPLPINGSKNKLSFEILFIVIVVIILIGGLNYFNILPLSKLLPNYLGFLPRRDVPTRTSRQSQQVNNAAIVPTVSRPPLKIPCPSVKEFCQTGNGIIKDGKYIGWGSVLASGSAIFAAFDGDLGASVSTVSAVINGQTVETKFKTAYLDNKELGLKATYFLKGRIIKTGVVKKGEQIAAASGNTISIYNDSSLVFSLIQGYPTKNNPVFLNKEHFE